MTARCILSVLVGAILAGCSTHPAAGPPAAGPAVASAPETGAATPAEPSPAPAEPVSQGPPDGIYVIFDASGSMTGRLSDGSLKLDVAREVFTFRPVDEVYLDEGSYEFRTRPNTANDLVVAESFAAGDRKEIVFGLAFPHESGGSFQTPKPLRQS